MGKRGGRIRPAKAHGAAIRLERARRPAFDTDIPPFCATFRSALSTRGRGTRRLRDLRKPLTSNPQSPCFFAIRDVSPTSRSRHVLSRRRFFRSRQCFFASRRRKKSSRRGCGTQLHGSHQRRRCFIAIRRRLNSKNDVPRTISGVSETFRGVSGTKKGGLNSIRRRLRSFRALIDSIRGRCSPIRECVASIRRCFDSRRLVSRSIRRALENDGSPRWRNTRTTAGPRGGAESSCEPGAT